jgi:hypothetical protein
MINLKTVSIGALMMFFSLLWSLCLFQYWSTDFGVYYLIGSSLDENHRLFKDFFDHKGPFYYFFINIISKIIGFGIYQAYITLALTFFIFLLSVQFAIKQSNKNYFFLLLFLSLSMMHTQNANISIQLFQSAIILLSFTFLFQFIEKKREFLLHISFVLFTLSIFTRIDAIIFFPVYLLIIFNNFKKNFLKLGYLIFFVLLYPFVIFLLFSYYFNFSLNDYFITNIIYNLNNSSVLREPFIRIFNSPAHIYFLLFTGVGYIFIEIIDMLIKKRLKNLKNIFIKKNIDLFASVLIISIASFFWLYMGSDKNYHVFILVTPIIFIIANYYKYLYLSKTKAIFIYTIVIFFALITVYPEQKNVIKNDCFNDYMSCTGIQKWKTIIDDTSNYEKPIIIGGGSWIYILNKKKTTYSINNQHFYTAQIKNDKIISFYRVHYYKTHKYILNQKKGYVFWIKKSLYNINKDNKYFQPSEYLLELIKITKVIMDQGDYLKVMIK